MGPKPTTYLDGRFPPEITTRNRRIVVAHRWLFRGDGFVITVPEGFATDLASVPRIVWPLVSAWDLSFAAPILHDYIYAYRGVLPSGGIYPSDRTFTRRQADRLFAQLMAEEGVVFWRRRLAWLAVRLFGWLPWARQ